MQHMGMNLWQWLFEGPIQGSLQESKGIAIGQNLPLRVRLDLREPYLIALPWEIMQPQRRSTDNFSVAATAFQPHYQQC
jgi:hypothetical protein